MQRNPIIEDLGISNEAKGLSVMGMRDEARRHFSIADSLSQGKGSP